MQSPLNAIEEVRCDNHSKGDGLGRMNTNCISSLFINHTWAWDMGVNTDPGWQGVTKRSHSPPLSKEVCLAGGHIDFTFTLIKESPEECGTLFNVPW